jgi:amino acid transporter
MSGDLKHPSKAIPKGTLYGLGLTFALYTMVIFALAASVSRETFYSNTNVIQLVSFQFYIYERKSRFVAPVPSWVCTLLTKLNMYCSQTPLSCKPRIRRTI